MMRKFYFLLLSVLVSMITRGQGIIAPDTACVGEPVRFTLEHPDLNFISYAWQFGSGKMTPVLTNSVPIPNTGTNGNRFSLSSSACMVYDSSSKKYYAFIGCASGGFNAPNVQRIDFGSDPHNPNPATVDLGNPNNCFVTNAVNGGNNNMEDMKVVLDANGIYHAFINNGGIVHWTFGNGLGSPPTQAVRIFSDKTVMGMGMNMAVINYKGSWYLFTGQTYSVTGGLLRFDLGPNLSAIPATLPYTIYSIPAGLWNLGYIAFLQENGNWYMFTSTLAGGSPLVRYEFGPNLLNPNPVATNLGGMSPPINLSRGMNFIKSCDTFFMLSLNENGDILAYNFENNIMNTPSTQVLGSVYGSGVSMQILYPYWYKDTLWALSASWMNNANQTVFRFPLVSIPAGNSEIKYYDPTITHTFNTPGVYDVTLYCDQGDNRGPQAYCTQIVILPGVADILGPDTAMCDGETYTLDASGIGASGYTWSDGSSGSALTVDSGGKYWVTLSGALCVTSDTINITTYSIPKVDLGRDTTICNGSEIILKSSVGYSAPTYFWNTGAADPYISVSKAGQYVLSVTEKGCTGSDTVSVSIGSVAVDLGKDTFICLGSEITLSSSSHYIAPVYQWNTGDKSASITVDQAGTYILSVADDNCVGSDTLTLKIMDLRQDLGEDLLLCKEDPLNITLKANVPDSNIHILWSTGAQTPSIQVRDSGTYWVIVSYAPCEGMDSVNIDTRQCDCELLMPNAFTPNGDGLNDIFLPTKADDLCPVTNYSLRVFNRWGQQVFYSAKPGIGWDGTVQGSKAEMDTYMYILTYTTVMTLKDKILKGDVVLIR